MPELIFEEIEGESLEIRDERWLALMTSQPGFERAARTSMKDSLARYDRTPLMMHISKDIVRMFYGYFALVLDARGGLTLSAMQELCTELGISSLGRAQAMLIHMRMIGFIKPNPERSDRRAKPFVPTVPMVNAFMEVMTEQSRALSIIDPNAAKLPDLFRNPEFFRAYMLEIGKGMTNLIKRDKPNPLQLFARRDAGMIMLYKICDSAEDGDSYPPRGPVRISVSALSKHYGVSRSHVLKLLRDAEAQGSLRRNADEQTGVIEEPLRQALISAHNATFIGISISARKAAQALKVATAA